MGAYWSGWQASLPQERGGFFERHLAIFCRNVSPLAMMPMYPAKQTTREAIQKTPPASLPSTRMMAITMSAATTVAAKLSANLLMFSSDGSVRGILVLLAVRILVHPQTTALRILQFFPHFFIGSCQTDGFIGLGS